jgi:hypothetical protein
MELNGDVNFSLPRPLVAETTSGLNQTFHKILKKLNILRTVTYRRVLHRQKKSLASAYRMVILLLPGYVTSYLRLPLPVRFHNMKSANNSKTVRRG